MGFFPFTPKGFTERAGRATEVPGIWVRAAECTDHPETRGGESVALGRLCRSRAEARGSNRIRDPGSSCGKRCRRGAVVIQKQQRPSESEFMGSGGTTTARLKLEGIDGRAHKGWSLWLKSSQHGETYQDQLPRVTDRLTDRSGSGLWWCMAVGGAWVDLASVDSANERDYCGVLFRRCPAGPRRTTPDSLRLSRRKRVAITGP